MMDLFEAVVKGEGLIMGEITYEIMSDEELLQVNREFLNHDYFTDIITFDNSVGAVINGDLLLSEDRVRDNASQLGVSYEKELNRVLIHGVLHLCGYADADESQKKIMRSKEDFYLKLV